ncbi:MAG: PDZ domain-containing protein [Gemmatimonadota bacterium]|nr:MAG: PDZ domain-containing protein [Gemmatimonadota bacterium]
MRSSRLRRACRSLLPVPLLGLGLVTGLGAQEEKGWIGITFDDSHCRSEERDEGRVVVWTCAVPPLIAKVYEGGPAYVAGMRSGDVIIGVNGLNILTEEAGYEFANMRLGVPMTFWVHRDGEELALTVTPTTREAAFGEDAGWVDVGPEIYDSLRIQMRALFEGQMRLQYALKEAEGALRRAEVELQRSPSETRRQSVDQLRLQIDSINTRLVESQKEIRLQVDSLAARAWVETPQQVVEVAPEVRAEIIIVAPTAELRALTVYADAVAGARFAELRADSPMIDYFPGVEEGLLIIQVVDDTPAYLAGLRAGDVVLEGNGEPVTTVEELRGLMHGDIEITYVRKGRKHVCTIPAR